MAKAIATMNLTAPAALKQVKTIAENSANVFILPHAKQRQGERGITLAQILECLRKGKITEGPLRDIKTGNWRVKMERFCSGQCVIVVAEIFTNEKHEKLLVVTTYLGG